ncbi:MAG: hypothetical protein KAS12_06215 [Candidatus Aenigmarchaeota archaeon]|nr:hypothetical protein [Candidatus Aenigmarchaeota archaeon]
MKGRVASLNDLELILNSGSRIVQVYKNKRHIEELQEPIDFYLSFLEKSVEFTINSAYGIDSCAVKRKKCLWETLKKYQLIESTNENPKYTHKLNADFETLLKEFLSGLY